MSTGNATNIVKTTEYYTVVNEDGEKKLNISEYVSTINKTKKGNDSDVTLEITSVDQFIEYEVYTIKITNETEKTILLGNKQMSNDIYLLDEKGKAYKAALSEINSLDLEISQKSSKEIKIKFNHKYQKDSSAKSLVFSKIVKNYDEYQRDSDSYNDFISIKVNL